MSFTIAVFIVLILAPAALWSQTASSPAASDQEADRRDIAELIIEISEAYVSRSAEPFERIMLDNYVSVRGKPVYNAREHLIAMMRADATALRSKRALDYVTLSFSADEPEIRIFGSAAIVTGMKRNEWQYRGSKCVTRYQSTDLWLKMNGKWRLAAGAANTIQCDPMPWHRPHPAVAAIPEIETPPSVSDTDSEKEIEHLLADIVKPSATETGRETETQSGPDRFFTRDFQATDFDAVTTNDRDALLGVLRSATAPAQRTSIENEAMLFYGDVAVYIFGLKTRGRLGTTERTKVVYYFTVLLKTETTWRFAVSHATRPGIGTNQ